LDFKDLLDEMQTKTYSSIINDLIMNKKIWSYIFFCR
jgi:hypothetical protein